MCIWELLITASGIPLFRACVAYDVRNACGGSSFCYILPALLLLAYIILVVSGERQREPLTREQAGQARKHGLVACDPHRNRTCC